MKLRKLINKLEVIASKHGDDLQVLTGTEFLQMVIDPCVLKDIGFYYSDDGGPTLRYQQEDAVLLQ